jgi:hypothetical protein
MPRKSPRAKAGKKNRKKSKKFNGGRKARPEESESSTSESEVSDLDLDSEMELRPRPLDAGDHSIPSSRVSAITPIHLNRVLKCFGTTFWTRGIAGMLMRCCPGCSRRKLGSLKLSLTMKAEMAFPSLAQRGKRLTRTNVNIFSLK